jgi:protein SCO1/2
MRYELFSASKLIVLLLATGMAAMNVGAEEAGHEHHDHHQHEAATDEAADPHAHHRAMLSKPVEPARCTEVDLLDLPLIDQDGSEVKFVSDVIGDRIVVMDVIYTTCTTVCPVISAVFGQMQKRLGDQLGKEVVLVSVSVDPIRDTPQRLKAYAASHKARPGWIWLTGNKRTMDRVLDGLGAYSPNFEDHPAMVLVGDGHSGEWSRFFGFPSPDRLMEQVDNLRAARNVAAGG